MELNTIFLIGPQGSGKGTQAKLLADNLGFYHWDMGRILRETSQQSSDIGRTVKDLIDKGILLNDDLLLSVAKAKLLTITPETGVVFDGIPRRLGQAEFLTSFLKAQGREKFFTIFLNLPRALSLQRLLLRSQQQKRADDTREAIELRLRQYENDTLPVLDFLKTQGVFYEVDGSPSVADVTQKINSLLKVQ